jgi:hypothetical protein
VALEGVDVVEGEEGEAFGGEEDFVLGEGAADQVVCGGAGDGVCEGLGGEPSCSFGGLVFVFYE